VGREAAIWRGVSVTDFFRLQGWSSRANIDRGGPTPLGWPIDCTSPAQHTLWPSVVNARTARSTWRPTPRALHGHGARVCRSQRLATGVAASGVFAALIQIPQRAERNVKPSEQSPLDSQAPRTNDRNCGVRVIVASVRVRDAHSGIGQREAWISAFGHGVARVQSCLFSSWYLLAQRVHGQPTPASSEWHSLSWRKTTTRRRASTMPSVRSAVRPHLALVGPNRAQRGRRNTSDGGIESNAMASRQFLGCLGGSPTGLAPRS